MKNESNIDRILRVILALILFVAGYFWFSGIVSIILYALSVVMLITGIIGYCGLYQILKINTNK